MSELLNIVHPGAVLLNEFLEPMEITPYRLAKDIGIGPTRIYKSIRCERGITPDTAIRLGRYLGTTPQFWMNLQVKYDLDEIAHSDMTPHEHIRPHSETSGGQLILGLSRYNRDMTRRYHNRIESACADSSRRVETAGTCRKKTPKTKEIDRVRGERYRPGSR